MNTFVNAVVNQEALTTNGMKARVSTANACVDLFYKIGAMRKQNAVPAFVAAYVENPEVALRIAQWARDVRGGAGERKAFRDILLWLESTHPEDAMRLLHKVPEIGRWDDLLVFTSPALKSAAFDFIAVALAANNGLCAKWMPRKGPLAVELRNHLGLTPKRYRKMLVEKTNVVETLMCAKDWNAIQFGKLPSLASARYKKAFSRNAKDHYLAYLEGLKKGTKKVNAGAVYPYDIIKTLRDGDREALQLVESQWAALPNYVGDANALAMVDVSASMMTPVSGAKVSALDVAVSLGLYIADKNTGKFKDTFLTFSGDPELLHLKGNIVDKVDQMKRSSWSTNTNVAAAFQKILDVAVKAKVPQSEMPEMLLILSDMQFDQCVITETNAKETRWNYDGFSNYNASALEVVANKYDAAGYKMPRIVFWNLNSHENVPVEFRQDGVALVSGFSPAIMKSILAGKTFTPEDIMLEAVMQDRYTL